MRFYYCIIIISLLLTSCKKYEGCTDPAALNYDAAANRDDGSCKYVGVNYPYELDIPSQFEQLLHQVRVLFSMYYHYYLNQPE